MNRMVFIGAIVCITALGVACRVRRPVFNVGMSAPQAGCHVRGALPDSACTPGASMTDDLSVICRQSTSNRRDVGEAEKRRVFAEYGISYPQPRGAYEVDHFIPLELGGSNDIANLWPEAAKPTPGFHEKDKIENYLHRQACSSSMSLQQARQEISGDWVQVYNQIHK